MVQMSVEQKRPSMIDTFAKYSSVFDSYSIFCQLSKKSFDRSQIIST